MLKSHEYVGKYYSFSKTCFWKTNDEYEKTRPTSFLINIEFLPRLFQASWIRKIMKDDTGRWNLIISLKNEIENVLGGKENRMIAFSRVCEVNKHILLGLENMIISRV